MQLFAIQKNRGYMLAMVLVFGAAFFVMFTAFAAFVVTQKRTQTVKQERARALDIAEAGLDYYKWYLAHNPEDATHGTGAPGPYVLDYIDPEVGKIGEYSLEISASPVCGTISAIDINSTGYTTEYPDTTRTIYARYMRPTVSEFAYIINADVWAGSDRQIVGPYHSNGAIRMDGTNNSTVSSQLSDYTCPGTLGCPSGVSDGTVLGGVYGDGPNSDLWTYPVTPVNFNDLTVDLADIKSTAQSDGEYVAPSTGFGYHVVFNANNTFSLYEVTGVETYTAYNSQDDNHQESNVITSETFEGTFTIQSDCPVIFVEDKVWLDGVVSEKVAFAAADPTSESIDPSIILNGDITYANEGAGLIAVAEDDVLVGLEVPNDMVLSGIFVAQKGRFGRNHYRTSQLDDHLDQYVTRNTLTMNGSIVSNLRVGTQWTCSGSYCSGFANRFNSFDRDLVIDPPPLTPRTADTYEFVEWREVE